MKNLFYILLLIIPGCNTRSETSQKVINSDTAAVKPKEIGQTSHIEYYTKEDTIRIIDGYNDSMKYGSEEFNKIVDNSPELYGQPVQHPDSAYSNYSRHSDDTTLHLFGGEVGQDEYYVLYAYFLKKRTGEARYASQRKNLIDIFNEMNSIFGKLYGGGTYYGHQVNRILGYAEYAIWQFKNSGSYLDQSPVGKQKMLYLTALRKKISHEILTNNIFPDKNSKALMQGELFLQVDNLGRLITDNFYLEKAEEFERSNYSR